LTGESDVVDPHTYNCTFPAMIVDCRKHFNLNSNGETDKVFPFGFVQVMHKCSFGILYRQFYF